MPVVVAPPVQGPPAKKFNPVWILVALAVLGAALFLFLMGMPYGNRSAGRPPIRQQPDYGEVVTEREAPATMTIGEIEPVSPPPQPAASVAPPPLVTPPPPSSSGEISESDAIGELRNYILSRRDYGVSRDCLVISSQGYVNRGYTMHAFDRCGESSMGLWRVDAQTRDVYRRQADGRFLRP